LQVYETSGEPGNAIDPPNCNHLHKAAQRLVGEQLTPLDGKRNTTSLAGGGAIITNGS